MRTRMELSPWSGTVVTCPLCDTWRRHTDSRNDAWLHLYKHLRSDAHNEVLAAQMARRALNAMERLSRP